MRLGRLVLVLSLWLVLVLRPIQAIDLPKATGYVNDNADILSLEFETKLNDNLSEYEKTSGNEIAVVTIKSLEELTIEEYGIELATEWGVGKEEKDNGLILLFAPNDKEVRIEIGYGLEGFLTDGQSGYILDTEFIPEYRKGNYEEAIFKTVEAIKSELSSEKSEEVMAESDDFSDMPAYLPILFIFLIYILSYLSRSKEFVTGGVIGFFGGLLINGLIAGIGLGVIGLILDFILSQNYKKARSRGLPTGFGSTFGGFKTGGGGKSSFGGFGGGSFGGGGSSRKL